MNTIQLHLNQYNLVRQFKNAFQDANSYLQELAQNARRAGATKVDFYIDPVEQTLVVQDDGCGIVDMAVLLQIAETGWSEAVIEKENPYGLGFLSILYQCEEIEVCSKGKCFRALTKDILQFQSIELFQCADEGHTSFKLIGIRRMTDFPSHIFQGFPLPIFVNNVEVRRVDTVDAGWSCDVGRIKPMEILGLDEVSSLVCYFQGFCVLTKSYGYYTTNRCRVVVHLDESKFEPTLPDRRYLIDSDMAEEQILAAVKVVFKAKLEQWVLTHADKPDIVCDWANKLKLFGLNRLFNDVDYLPKEFAHNIKLYPRKEFNSLSEMQFAPILKSRHIHRRLIENGKVRLYDINSLIFDRYNDGETFEKEMYVWLTKGILVDPDDFDPDHWIHTHINFLLDPIDVEIVNPVRVKGDDSPVTDICCDYYILKGPFRNVMVHNHGAYLPYFDNGCRSSGIVMPKGDETDNVLYQAECYFYEHELNRTLFASESYLFLRHLRLFRCDSKPSLLKMLIGDTLPSKLHGNSFIVNVSENGQCAIEQA